MKEALLHYIWRFQRLNTTHFRTTEGDTVLIYFNGHHNHNAGPDFLNARIKIGEILWHGSVEIHIRSSDWTQHRHHTDLSYNNVILHVVWEDNKPAIRENGHAVATVELKDRVEHDLLIKCQNLIENKNEIPCAGKFKTEGNFNWSSMLQSTGVERLESKSNMIESLLINNKMDWEETAYQVLAMNFGFKVNKEPFLKLAQSLPYKIILKHTGNLFQIEALLFGTAGLLNQDCQDEYFLALCKEYEFLRRKYSLYKKELFPVEWKKLRMRPASFPELRIAQLAAVMNDHNHFFDAFVRADAFGNTQKIMKSEVSEYWKKNYGFGIPSRKFMKGRMGKSSISNIVINTIAPLLMAYSKYLQNESYADRAIHLLEGVRGENNKIIRIWNSLDIAPQNSFESQALIQLYNNYCLKKKCLSCKIGVSLIQ